MSIWSTSARRHWRAVATVMLAALMLWALLSPAIAAMSPGRPPPGYARIWLYRLDEPYVSLARPYVRFNGRIVGISEPGGAFYRDLAPGKYYVTVDSQGRDVNQFVDVNVAASQQVYIEVQVLISWDCTTFDSNRCSPTFYTRLQPPQVAIATIAHSTPSRW
jgi:hypothetical protein